MHNYAYILWIPLLPLATFVVLGLFGRRIFSRSAGWIGSLSLFAATVLSFIAAKQYFFVDGRINGVYQKITAYKFTWLSFAPGMSIDMGVVIDAISVMMLVVVSFVSLMVHVFSMGYMKGETRFVTYYAFLSLFTFSMLALVLSTKLFQVYIFWELVGVSSFLLIGFYYDKPSAVSASKKAFIVTRFADLGFLVGILILAFYGRTLDIAELISKLTNLSSPEFTGIATAGFLGVSALSWALTLLFIGGAGKSAMFPLHIWLPDAMEGPTPVSALIHAATMVVAGVFLVARMFPVFVIDAGVMQLITCVGAFSALLAAVIACTQTDLKRVLALSTMSQIGYMMFALGISKQSGEDGLGYMSSMFHLFTHAFFKSLLFLCAGMVIHKVHSNELRHMGGLRKQMPIAHLGFLVGCLAIAGIPPFSGFFSKEEILTAALHAGKLIFVVALFTAALTAFYMFRLYFSVFWNKESQAHTSHGEGSLSMKIPVVILSICAAAAGLLPFSSFITANGVPLTTHINLVFSAVPVSISLAAILVAMYLYKKPRSSIAYTGTIYKVVKNKFYIDELYLFITKKIIFPLIGQPVAWIDKNVVDGMMNVLADCTAILAARIKGLQSGRVQWYALVFAGGIGALVILLLYAWK